VALFKYRSILTACLRNTGLANHRLTDEYNLILAYSKVQENSVLTTFTDLIRIPKIYWWDDDSPIRYFSDMLLKLIDIEVRHEQIKTGENVANSATAFM
jgi:hypothetical protein